MRLQASSPGTIGSSIILTYSGNVTNTPTVAANVSCNGATCTQSLTVNGRQLTLGFGANAALAQGDYIDVHGILVDVSAGSFGSNLYASATGGGLYSGTTSVQVAYVSDSSCVTTVLDTTPSGLQVTLGGSAYTAPQSFTLRPNSPYYTIGAPSPQSGAAGTQYVFSSWSDGGAQTHFVGPASNTTYTASFVTQYLLTTAVNPAGTGSVSPNCSGSGCWYNSGAGVSLQATPNSGYNFSNWSGSVASSANPLSLTMSGPRSETANFNPPSALSVSSVALNFGPQGVGTTSAGQTVTVSNGGSNSVGLGIAIPGDFAQTNTCGGTLAAAASCTVTVTFTPTLAGPRSGSLSISDVTLNGIRLVRLFGTGTSAASVGAKLRLSIIDLNFGVHAVSTPSAATVVTLTNDGDATLTVTSVSAGGDFAQSNNCSSVAVSGNCTISVTFTPTVAGARLGAITIVDSATGSPHVIHLFGTGSGTAPAIGFSSVRLNFGNQANGVASAAKTVTVTNTGNATLTITAVTPSGDFSASGCVTSLAPAATCTLSITFTPTTVGIRRGRVAVIDNATGSPHVIRLFGKGT